MKHTLSYNVHIYIIIRESQFLVEVVIKVDGHNISKTNQYGWNKSESSGDISPTRNVITIK